MHTLIEVLFQCDNAISFVPDDKGIAVQCFYVERIQQYPWLYALSFNGEKQRILELSDALQFVPVAYEPIWW